jgi:MFS family permease
VLATVMVGSFMALFDQFVVVIALPTIRSDLDTSLSTAELVIAGYALPYSVLLVTGSRLGDRWTPKRAYIAGMAAFTLASLACGLAPTADVLVAARVAQGASAAVMTPQVLATIHAVFAPPERTRALGVFSSVNGSASVLGQVAGGLLLALDPWGLSWRFLFLVNLPIGIAGIAAALVLLPTRRPARPGGTLDVAGVALLTVALVLVTTPLVLGPQEGWPPWSFLSLAAAAPAAALFLAHERRLQARGRRGLVDLALFRQRTFSLGALAALLLFAQAAGLFFVLTVTLQDGLGLGALAAGLVFAPLGAGFVTASLVAPRLLRRVGPRVVVTGYAVAAAASTATAILSLALGDRLSAWILVPTLVVVTCGNGLATSPLTGLVMGRVEQTDSGLAAATIATSMQLGQLAGLAVIGLVFATALGDAPAGDVGRYAHAFAAAVGGNVALLAAAILLVTLVVRETRARTTS